MEEVLIPLALAAGLLVQTPGARNPSPEEEISRLEARRAVFTRYAEIQREVAKLRADLAATKRLIELRATVDRMPIGKGEKTVPMPTSRGQKTAPMPNGAPTRYLDLYGENAKRKP